MIQVIIVLILIFAGVFGYFYYENLNKVASLEAEYVLDLNAKTAYSGNVSQEAELFRTENRKLLDKYNKLNGFSTTVTQEAQQYKTKYQLTNELLEKEKLEKELKNSIKKGALYGNNYIDYLLGGDTTPEDCRKWAKTKGYPMFGHRNGFHASGIYKNSCMGYATDKVKPFYEQLQDLVTVTACTDPTKKTINGCTDASPVDGFYAVPNTTSAGNDIFSTTNVPLVECQKKCNDDSNCTSFEAAPNGTNFNCWGKGQNRIYTPHDSLTMYFKA